MTANARLKSSLLVASLGLLLSFQNCQGFLFQELESASRSFALDDPGLGQIFDGRATFVSMDRAERLSIQFSDPAVRHVWDQKLPLFQQPGNPKVFGITRGFFNEALGRFGLYLLESDDGINFRQYGNPLFMNLRDSWSIYDPHIAVDESRSPALYIMAMECVPPGVGASVCISTSTAPWDAASWTQPRLIVENNGLHSASIGGVLVDQGRYFLKWTQLDDGTAYNGDLSQPDEGFERTTTRAIELTNLVDRHGNSDIGRELIGAERNVYCNSSWDCNNADVQDWKRIGNYYYAIYNGANYYRCIRPDADKASYTSQWAIGIRRSTTPLGDYSESTGPLITSGRNDTCGISYPVVNTVNGRIYMYYADYGPNGEARFWRVGLTWNENVSQQVEVAPTLEQSRIHGYYRELLGREPSSGEVAHWQARQANEALMPKQLAQGILFSQEFMGRYNSLPTDSKIEILYRGLLGRSPDATGLGTFRDLINRGESLSVISDVFLDSQEFRDRH